MVVTVHAPVLRELRHYTTSAKFKCVPAFVCEKITLRKARAVIAVSDATRVDLVSMYGIAPGKIYIVNNGVDFEILSS